MRTRLDHAVIHVSDWARSNAFYRDVLGAEVLGDDPGPVARQGAKCDGTSVYFRDPDGSLLEFISYG
jgi:catechol 2,3-dioxygenase-like lactoylglutathione lyase family enzyme